MKILRAEVEGAPRYGALEQDDAVTLWSDAPWLGGTPTKTVISVHELELLPPVVPSKIVCVGRNYRSHAAELGNQVPEEPLLFLKPPSSLLAHGGTIELPSESQRVDHEGELAVVLGRPLTQAAAEDLGDAIFGFTCANDVTARDLQRRDVQFTRAKGFDTFCPVGPWVETEKPSALELQLRVNDELRQHGTEGDMCFSIVEILQYVSNVMTLLPGDLVLTGTPEGVGPITAGDQVEVEIPGIGLLRNKVAERPKNRESTFASE